MNTKKITIAVDGYASCGKSTLAKDLAKSLQYIYLDSGAMYRAVTLYFLQNEVVLSDKNAVAAALEHINIDFRLNADTQKADAYLNGENVEHMIRNKQVSQRVSEVAAIEEVRHFLVAQQQAIGKNKGISCDGRDIGTVVFPDAELKLFVTAELEVRAARRYAEAQRKGLDMTLEDIKINLQQRDEMDTNRAVSPLRKADDAILLNNSYLTREEQLNKALQLAKNLINS